MEHSEPVERTEEMPTRVFTLALGVVYLVFGIIGFIPALYTHPPASAPHLDISGGYGYLFGLFPVNVVHDIFNIVVGLGALAAAARETSAAAYCRFLFPVFGILTFLGFVPHADALWGLAPILTNDTWLDAGTALLVAYFGYVAPAPTHVEHAPQHSN